MTAADLPAVNALLNGTCAALLLAGYAAIRRRRMALHRGLMIAALACSALFLAGYLVYHAHVGSVPYRGSGWPRAAYFAILITHTVLAATVARAARGRFDRHAALARVTLPIWLYVSVTGVVIYVMLYGPPPPFR
jgi:uncharacterized membrane protein YozB (DUF420 family)